jgi:putative protein kinase ArgK-like GTPase of G3E family
MCSPAIERVSRGGSVIEAEQAAEPLVALHAAVVVRSRCAFDDQRVRQDLMRALDVIVVNEFDDEHAKMVGNWLHPRERRRSLGICGAGTAATPGLGDNLRQAKRSS